MIVHSEQQGNNRMKNGVQKRKMAAWDT